MRALVWPWGGLIEYRASPVGPYRELLAVRPVLHAGRLAGHVPFMAVDSAGSRAGGREHWALPKELATFAAGTVRGGGWTVRVGARVRPRAVPVVLAGTCVQPWPGGRERPFRATFRGRARAAAVTIEAVGVAPFPRAATRPALLLEGTLGVGVPRS